MVQITLINNPFQPQDKLQRLTTRSGLTVQGWLLENFGPDFEEFDKPTVCHLNGQVLLRRDWTRRLEQGDHLTFTTLPDGVVSIILAVVSIAIAIFIGAKGLLGDPKVPGEAQNPDAAYTLRGQNNRLRPGEPVEVVYGRCRIWPTYVSRPYSRYVGNKQYQYSLFCLGHGDFDIHGTYLDDTLTSRFDEVELELCPPGTDVTLVEGSVFTSLEVSNIELLGPNEEGYDGFSGPFTLNEDTDPIRRIEVDISFPSGLYKLNDEGKSQPETVSLLFQYRNMAGGSWTDIVSPTITRSTNTPQRITYSVSVPAGQYEVRGRRTSNRVDSAKSISQVRWEAAKGYGRLKRNFGQVYVIAMKALATGQLNDNSARSFNVRATRKLPVWNGTTWLAPAATRNPVWAFCDVMRATYGAKLPDEYLDLSGLLTLAGVMNAQGITFDWIFDQPLTVWEAAKTVLRVGRATPIPQGSLITAVRDEVTSVVTAVFNQHNIVKGSLTQTLNMFEFQSPDATRVEYIEWPSWKPKTVDAVLPGRAGTNPEMVKLPGCTSRDQALREGLYLQSRRELQRTVVTFRTGSEGYIPVFMDLIAVTHDTVRIGQGGMILAYDSGTNELTLSEQPTFSSDEVSYVIALRKSDGSLGDLLPAFPGSAANKVLLLDDPDPLPDFTENQVPPLYVFGIQGLETFYGKVMEVRPVDFQTFEITCVNYVPENYDHDEVVADPPDDFPVIENPGDPEVPWVEISGILENAAEVNVVWGLAEGATSYLLEVRYLSDDEPDPAWQSVGQFPTGPVKLAIEPGEMQVRVAPFRASGNVIWTTSEPFVSGSSVTAPVPPGLVTQPSFSGLILEAVWSATADADGFVVEVWPDGAVAPIYTSNVGASTQFEYTRDQFELDSPLENFRDFDVLVYGFNAGGLGDPLMIARNNPVPAAPASLAHGSPTGSDYPVSWTWEDVDDLLEFNVYASTTPGFTPGPGNLVDTTTDLTSVVTAAVTTYWRVGAVDVWGDEETLSSEATITV